MIHDIAKEEQSQKNIHETSSMYIGTTYFIAIRTEDPEVGTYMQEHECRRMGKG